MIVRKNYLEKLFAWKDEKIIKVVTGIEVVNAVDWLLGK